GLPFALIAYHDRLNSWLPGAHIGTFRGNQLAMAGSATMLEMLPTVSAKSCTRWKRADETAG
ncbi:MAG: hypothetical protein MI754_05570, partial [Chromatiales bacterium]|nr:hypothetical protein [Chromatiales bacterium]